MGAAVSTAARQVEPPEDIADFRKHAVPSDQYIIPEIPAKRQITDLKFTLAFGVCLLFLVPFLIYTFVNADVDRFTHGYDKCGNVCGKQNSHVDGISCSGRDKTTAPLLQYIQATSGGNHEEIYVPDECVNQCSSSYLEIFNRCFPATEKEKLDGSDFTELLSKIARDIHKCSGTIVALSFIGLGFCFGMLCLFRYFVAYVVWFIITGSVLGIVALTILFWYLSGIPQFEGFKGVAIMFTIVSIILIIMVICMFKRIKLVIRLFKEAIKVVFGIPLILVEPLLTLLAGSILLIIFVYFFILFGTSGYLTPVTPDLFSYAPNGAMLFTFYYHLVICLWMSQFIIGCQHMVISGAVSSYYFARDKGTVTAPIYYSFYNLLRYHLGTVAFGSLIITIIALIKALIRSLVNNKHAKLLIDCCLGSIETFLKYLSKNAYIQTAMHGQPFFKSGKRAVRLLAANAISAIAVNSVGDFVLGMAKLLIVICTAGVGVAMNDNETTHFWAVVVIGVFVTAIIADCFFAVFETSIDTIFLCFCEDSCMNDGMSRPYYMSTNLMQYMEDAKKTIKDKN